MQCLVQSLMAYAFVDSGRVSHCCVGKLEGAMKDLVATVAKGLDKAQQTLAARVAQTFAILWCAPVCDTLDL